MTELLDKVLTAPGGAERWQSISSITARGRLDGLLPKRFAGNKLANFTFQVQIQVAAGYASWNYLTAPLLLTRDDITVTEAEPWQESGQRWRRHGPVMPLR